MAEFINSKMLLCTLFFLLTLNNSFILADDNQNKKSCSCYDACYKNFTSVLDINVQKIKSCQRGCRFYSLALHTSHVIDLNLVKHSCFTSCKESYKAPIEKSACEFGCSVLELAKELCKFGQQTPHISYSFLIEESDVLIHPGEPDPDEILTDPGLRRQFLNRLEALFETKAKLPEIHFKNLPVKPSKQSIPDYSQFNFKCPKFYGLDSKFEFRNGKVIIGDLYLFVGVFVFVVVCFLLGHHIETKNLEKRYAAKKALDTEYLEDEDGLQPLIDSEAEGLEDQWDVKSEKSFSAIQCSCPQHTFQGVTINMQDSEESEKKEYC